jgi:ABC-type amino acid transport substrate-binding protein
LDKKPNTVYLATLNWPPYVGEELPGNGYTYELITESYHSIEMNVEIEYLPFARILNKIKSGNLDGYFPEYYNQDYEKEFEFSDSFPGGEVGFYVRNDFSFPLKTEKDMRDFHGIENFTVGTVRGYVNTSGFDSANYLKKQETSDDFLNLKKLYFKRVDMIFIDRNVAEYIILNKMKKYMKKNESMKFIDEALENKNLYVCFSKKTENHLLKKEKFNEGLAIIKKSGKLKMIQEKNGFKKGKYNG